MTASATERLAASLVMPPEVEGQHVYLFLGVGEKVVWEAIVLGPLATMARSLREGDAVVVTIDTQAWPFPVITEIEPLNLPAAA